MGFLPPTSTSRELMHPSHLLARRAQCSDDFQSTLQRPCIHPSHLLARRALMNTPRRSYCEHAAQASAMDQIVLRARCASKCDGSDRIASTLRKQVRWIRSYCEHASTLRKQVRWIRSTSRKQVYSSRSDIC